MSDKPNPFTQLLQSRRFWLALLALIEAVLFTLKPDFPSAIWTAVSNVLLVLIVGVTVENIAQHIAAGLLTAGFPPHIILFNLRCMTVATTNIAPRVA